MGRYESHKNPFQMKIVQWAQNRINTGMQRLPKSMPCHVTEVAQDFIKVAFETANGIFTPPIVKIPQAMSQYAREPTQVGDKGHAVPGNYYLGGVTGMAGGGTDFFPRGNLTTLNFNGISHTQNPSRNYDQLTHMAGPAGWIANAFQGQQKDQQQQQSSVQQTSPTVVTRNLRELQTNRTRMMNIQRSLMNARNGIRAPMAIPVPSPRNGSTSSSGGGSSGSQSSQQGQTQDQGTNFNFDKNNLCTIQSKDKDHNITVDSGSQKMTLNLPVGEWGYAGGDGKKGKYARIMTESGPSVNFKARIG
jgi:hypothetical protein